MEKLNKDMKLRLLAMFLFSNLASLMLGGSLTEEPKLLSEIETITQREGYMDLALNVEVSVDLIPQTPFVLTNKTRTLYIPFAFFIKKEIPQDANPFNSETLNQGQRIILSLPKKYITKVLTNKNLVLLPQLERKFVLTHTKRRNHEIHF